MKSFWNIFVSGLQQRCPICMQRIPDEYIKDMKDISKNVGMLTCQDCWLASNYAPIRLQELLYFYHGQGDEFVVHPYKPNSLVFRKGEKPQGEAEKVFHNMINFAQRYSAK